MSLIGSETTWKSLPFSYFFFSLQLMPDSVFSPVVPSYNDGFNFLHLVPKSKKCFYIRQTLSCVTGLEINLVLFSNTETKRKQNQNCLQL